MESDHLVDNLFLGAGAMKAGTTWLYSVLDTHPEIFFSLEKEIHYFYARYVDRGVLQDSTRLENVRTKYLRIDPATSRTDAVKNRLRWSAAYLDGPLDDDWYRGLFLFRKNQKFVADFSNLYALLPASAWRKIHAQVRTLRVLYTMRDPVKRLWSHVKFHLKVTGREQLLETWRPSDFDRFVRQDFIWANAEYGRAVRRMKSALPADALKFVWHDTVHEDEVAFLRDLEAFLGLPAHDYDPARLAKRVNPSAHKKMPDFFPELFAKDIERILGELRDEGLTIPDSWSIPGLAPA